MIDKRLAMFVIGFFYASVAAAEPAASGDRHVVRLRADEVVLTPSGWAGKQRTFRRDDFKGSWPFWEKGPTSDPEVEVDGKRYRVAAVDVVTDEQRKPGPCINQGNPKPGATRGFDNCK